MLSKRRLSPWFLFALLLILGAISIRVVGVFLDYVLVGLLFAYLSHPGYQWLEQRLRRPWLSSIIMVIVVSITVLGPASYVLIGLVTELRDIIVRLDPDALTAFVQQYSDTALPGLLTTVIPSLDSFASQLATELIRFLAEGLIGAFVLLYVLYYTYIDGERFLHFTKELLPMQEAHRDLLFHEIAVVTRAVMFGQVLTAAIQAVLAGVGYLIFGVPNVIFWAFITFILALLPVIGPPLIWIPWGAYLIVSGNTFQGIGLLVYSAVMVSGLDNLIRPKLIGSRAHVHPVVVLLGILGGLTVFGFSGFILGPLTLSVFVTILDVYRKEFAMKLDDDSDRYLTGR